MSETQELTIYTNWEHVPDNLKTRTSLKKMGLKPKRGQQPVAIKESTWRSRVSQYKLYDANECVPNTLSAKQQAALEKAQAKSLEKRTCKQCGWVEHLSPDYRSKQYVSDFLCSYCRDAMDRKGDRDEAIAWAQRILDGLTEGVIDAHEVLILDSETTDLYGEIIELAMIDLRGEVVYNGRFNPVSAIEPGAAAVHGLTAKALADEPTFASEYETIRQALDRAGLVLIYNAEFDLTCLQHTAKLHGGALFTFKAECLMHWYAQFCGEWSDYHGNYRWQPLPGGDHSALGDCQASLSVLKEMAGANTDG